jgi:hypothetical protein
MVIGWSVKDGNVIAVFSSESGVERFGIENGRALLNHIKNYLCPFREPQIRQELIVISIGSGVQIPRPEQRHRSRASMAV